MSGQEKQFENKIKSFLKSRGHYHVKFFANAYTKVGVPDILACVNGYFLGIEVKAEKGKPSELQLLNRKQIRADNGYSVIVFPEQFEMLVELVELLERDKYEQARNAERRFDRW